MVVLGEFKMELVDAKTKCAFPEHGLKGKTYVEVEIGTEYFVSVQKIAATTHPIRVSISVDGNSLKAKLNYNKGYIDKEPHYKGLRSKENGCSMHTSLVFDVPPNGRENATASRRSTMGVVKLKIYERVVTDAEKQHKENSMPNFGIFNGTDKPNAALRSVMGTTTTTKRHRKATGTKYKDGPKLNTSNFRCTIAPPSDSKERGSSPHMVKSTRSTRKDHQVFGKLDNLVGEPVVVD